MNVVKTYVAPSTIDGLGMFAGEFIPKGALIWRLDGIDIITNDEQLESLKLNINQRQYIDKYSYQHETYYVFCSDDQKYCNHSDTPNTMCDYKTQVATRDIEKGEEITCNYAEFIKDFTGYHASK